MIQRLLAIVAALAVLATPAAATDRKPVVIGSDGQKQQIQSGDTLSTPALKVTGITGSTQCLHVNSSGTVSGTASDCPSSSGTGALTFVTSATVAGSAATTLSVSGLDLDTDGRYFVILTLKNATTSTSNISLYYNSDTTAANYDTQSLTANNTTISGTRANNAIITALDSNTASTGSGNTVVELWISNDIDAHPTASIGANRFGNSNILIQKFAHQWRTASTNVTGITLSASVASSLAVGSKIEVWKLAAS